MMAMKKRYWHRMGAVLLSASMALLCACTAQPAGETIAVSPSLDPVTPSATPPATLSYTMRETTAFYNEGSTEENADYVLRYSLPFFTDGDAVAQAQNEAIQLYEEELTERVRSERLPLADRTEGQDAPGTEVKAEVLQANGCVSVILWESVFYDAEVTESLCTTLVFDENGQETSLYAQSGLYTPEALVAQQVWNVIDVQDPDRHSYYGDLTLEDIRLALDLYNGFAVTDSGYRMYFAAGTLAKEELGVQIIDFSRNALYPDFVDVILSASDYAALMPSLHMLATACAAYYQSFDKGAPPAYVATAFMAQFFAALPVQNGYRCVDEADYMAAFSRYFRSFPTDLGSGDGTALVDGVYRIPDTRLASYGLRLDNAYAENGEITLTGMLYYGKPGDASTGELTSVSITLSASAQGYIFEAFSIR